MVESAEEVVMSAPSPEDTEDGTWRDWVRSMVLWAAQDPWSFLFNVFLILSPFLLISLYLSYRLSYDIESQKKEKKRKVKRDSKGRKKKNKEG